MNRLLRAVRSSNNDDDRWTPVKTVSFFHDTINDVYSLNFRAERLAVKDFDQIGLRLFEMRKFGEIFEGYNEETDTIGIEGQGRHYVFVHKRKGVSSNEVDLPAGVYKFVYVNHEFALKPVRFNDNETYIEMNSSVNKLTEDLNSFLDLREGYENLNMAHRRGCFVWGPPGNGKTFTIMKNIRDVIKERDAVVIIVTSVVEEFDEILDFRTGLEGRDVIFLIEEISERSNDGAEDLLSFLDGEFSWNNCYTIATTNYPEEIEPNIINRPGRFDLLVEVGLPGDEEREIYLKERLGEVDDFMIDATEGYSVAFLKELVLRIKLHGKDFDAIMEEFEEWRKTIKQNFPDKDRPRTGFGLE